MEALTSALKTGFELNDRQFAIVNAGCIAPVLTPASPRQIEIMVYCVVQSVWTALFNSHWASVQADLVLKWGTFSLSEDEMVGSEGGVVVGWGAGGTSVLTAALHLRTGRTSSASAFGRT